MFVKHIYVRLHMMQKHISCRFLNFAKPFIPGEEGLRNVFCAKILKINQELPMIAKF